MASKESKPTSTKSSRKIIPVRQTLASKMRLERGNQLQYQTTLQEKLKANIAMNTDVTITDSKESRKSENYKKPTQSSISKSSTAGKNESQQNTYFIDKTGNKARVADNFKKPLQQFTSKPFTAVKKQNQQNTSNIDKTGSKESVAKSDNFKNPSTVKKIINYVQQNKLVISANKKPIPKIVVTNSINPTKTNRTTFSFIERNKNSKYSAPLEIKKPKPSLINSLTASNKIERRVSMENSKLNKTVGEIKVRQSILPCKNPNRLTSHVKPIIAPKEIKKPIKNIQKSVTIKSPMRKSLTAMHFKRVSNINPLLAIHKSISVSEIPVREVFSTIHEEAMFTTPSVAKRRSISIQTPATITKSSMSPWSGCWSPSAVDLKRRLSVWIEKRGKPLQAYHHLRRFGIPKLETLPVDEEDKENIEVLMPEKCGSYENIPVKLEQAQNVDAGKNDEDKFSIATDALYDLHKLILDGYPRDQCEAWLDVITTRFGELEDQPQYWECRAALEETRGDFTNAVDCYTNAIIQGAKVENVDESLGHLMEKFNFLNISTATKQQLPNAKDIDARNIFKSNVIKFAVQERSKKSEVTVDKEANYSATPVRRSTRFTRSQYSSTSGVKICASLDELESSVRDSLHFKVNKALHK